MHVDELWIEYKKTNDIDIRNEIVMEYLPEVKKVVNSMLQGLNCTHIRDDYYSIGVLGLIDAVHKFDYKKNVKFQSYASIRIRGAVKDHMRKQDWLSRGVRDKQKKIEEAEMILRKRNLKDPTDKEIAIETGMSINEVCEIMEMVTCANLISFEHAISNGLSPMNKTSLNELNPEYIYEREEIKKILIEAIEKLDEREQQILSLYYKEELKLKEIGHVMKISESRISQILKNIIKKLQEKLKIQKNLPI